MKIDFLRPNITEADIERMAESIRTGWLVHGKYTKQFEMLLDEYLNNTSFVTSSCTAALHMSLILAGVGKGDEVITTPLSWVSTANSILYQGAKPVFVDVDPKTGILDIDRVEESITPLTKAIIVVHLYGQMADMKKLSKIANKHGLKVIEDAAHALEAERDGIKPGQLGFTACLSFHAAKNITCGQGGAIITKQKDQCKLLVRDGVQNIDGKRVMTDWGYKYDLTDFQAALLIGQMERIKESHEKRLDVFAKYQSELSNWIRFPETTGKHACHMFVIWTKNRDQVRKKLLEKGIQTSIHYPPIHLEPYYQKLWLRKGSLSIAERMGEETITLPTYALTNEEQDYVIQEVNKLCE